MPMRRLAISIGNTSLFAGVFSGRRLTNSFRLNASELVRLPGRVRGPIEAAVVGSVVPALTEDVLRLVRRTWAVEAMLLTATSAHGLKIGYRRPRDLGADRVAAALGAREKFPGRDIVVVDCGTATTVTALRGDGTICGGAILPGVGLWTEMLAGRTAQLPRVAPARPRRALGRSTREGIEAGVFFGHLGAMRETVGRVRREAFDRGPAMVVGTGGQAARFRREKIFDALAPNLVLHGLRAFAAGGKDR
ncbi:MAG TPA: type III pantothenate kinase [Opitutus sp.]|nr:type III pantothenate kinase [Opitutus sp.]